MCHVVLFAHRAPGYKFRGRQFEKPGYTRIVGGRRGLSSERSNIPYWNKMYYLGCITQSGEEYCYGL